MNNIPGYIPNYQYNNGQMPNLYGLNQFPNFQYNDSNYYTNDSYYQSQLSWTYSKLQKLENENAYLKRCKKRLEKKINNTKPNCSFNNMSFEILRNPFPSPESNNDDVSQSEKENNKSKKICYTPNKLSYDKEKITELIENLNSIDDIINLPEDKFIRHNKYLNKVLKIREALIDLNNLM